VRPDWRALAARGDHAAAVSAFERADSGALDALDLGGLRTLADSARYAGRPELAERALAATRLRAAGTPAAHQAAFLLGRVAADLRGDDVRAARWFATYLEESPEGPLAEEALGRRVDSLSRAGLKPEAEAAAREYLRLHPDGVFGALARHVLE
jgi:tetratricopeptide (TPR) repeat protein